MKEKVVDPTAQIEVMTNDILDSSHSCVYIPISAFAVLAVGVLIIVSLYA